MLSASATLVVYAQIVIFKVINVLAAVTICAFERMASFIRASGEHELYLLSSDSDIGMCRKPTCSSRSGA